MWLKLMTLRSELVSWTQILYQNLNLAVEFLHRAIRFAALATSRSRIIWRNSLSSVDCRILTAIMAPKQDTMWLESIQTIFNLQSELQE